MAKCRAGKGKLKLKDPRTFRVFFSSPFGGMEEERDELMRRYFPQIRHLCNARGRGVDFIPVDMRWGITEEAAGNAETVDICLREIDRCDMFVGFYAQRYGWHGEEDLMLQRNFELAFRRYPWVRDKRKVSVTELEFLHGHLNKPGRTPACFFFRDKGFDDEKAADLEKAGSTKQAEKFRCESEDARKKLESLRKRVEATKNQVLALHLDYFTPEEGVNYMFNTIWEYLQDTLGEGEGDVETRASSNYLEDTDHFKFLTARQSLYIGGDKSFRQLDTAIKKGESVLVTGRAGQGKSSLLANWIKHLHRTQPKLVIVYHFIGSSHFSNKASNILRRLSEGIAEAGGLPSNADRKSDDVNDVRCMMGRLQSVLEKCKKNVVLVIDGLEKVEKGSKTTKSLYWLLSSVPRKACFVVSTQDSDMAAVEQLVKARHFQPVAISDLDVNERRQCCEGRLGKWGKSLSSEQVQAITSHPETGNPRFLCMLLAELSVFGSFRQLGDKLDSLLHTNSIAELAGQLLGRIETDCDSLEWPNLVKQILSLVQVSRAGLSESELMELLQLPVQIWLPVYFRLEPCVHFHSGLLQFSFLELCDAVETRYLSDKTVREKALQKLCTYFDEKRKNLPLLPKPSKTLCLRPALELPWLQQELKDKPGLVRTLLDLNMMSTLMENNSYGLLELWQWTGYQFPDVAEMYLTSFQQAVQSMSRTDVKQDPVPSVQLVTHLQGVYRLMDLAACTPGLLNISRSIINFLEGEGGGSEAILNEHRYYMACALGNAGDHKEAESIYRALIQYWKQAVKGRGRGQNEQIAQKYLAMSLNGLGLLLYHQHNYTQAEQHFSESERLHAQQGDRKLQADCLVNQGLVHLATQRLASAVHHFLQAAKLYEAVHFDSVPHILGNVYNNLGLAYRRMDRLEDAEQMYRRSLEIKLNAVGPEHRSVGVAYVNLATVALCRKLWGQVEQLSLQALNIFKAGRGGERKGLEERQCEENLLYSFLQQDKYLQAETRYWALFDALTSQEGWDECLPWVHNTIAKHYLESSQPEKSERILTALVRSRARTPVSFILLDQLDQQAQHLNKRRPEETMDHAIKLFPKNRQLLKQKVLSHYIARQDVDGAMSYWESISAGPREYAELAEWCMEAGHVQAAVSIQQKAIKLFEL